MAPPKVWNISDLLAELAALEYAQRPLSETLLRDAIVTLMGGGDTPVQYQKKPRQTFSKIYAAASAPSLINFIALGDSMAEFKPRHLCAVLQRTLIGNIDQNAPNVAGVSQQLYAGCFCGVGATVNYTFLTGQWSYWPAGELHRLTSGGSVAWNFGGVNPTFTKLKVYYITEPGGGTLTVTVGGVLKATIDTGTGFSGIGLGIFNYSQALSQQSVVVACTAGTVKLIEVHKLDDSVSGINYFFSSQGGVALNDMMSTATGRANLQTYLADASIDLMTFEAKEASIEPDGSTYASRLAQLADILDAACPNADKVMIASTPVAVNDADQVACNATLNALATSRGYIFWDGYTPVKSYATLVALGWQGDGVHPANQCSAYLAELMHRDLGFARAMFGLEPRAVSNRGSASNLGRGTTIGAAPGQQITFDADPSTGLDWFLKLSRNFAVTADDVVGAGTVSAAAGVATFTTSQAGALVAGAWLLVGGVPYLVSTFNGTTGATLAGAPTFAAIGFSIRTVVFQFSASPGTHPNVLPSALRFDTELAGPGMSKGAVNALTFLKLDNTALTPALQLLEAGAILPGVYTKATLPAVAGSGWKGAIAVASDGAFDGSAALMMARGISNTDYVPIVTGLAGVSADHGDGGVTLQSTDAMTQRWTLPLTANRAVAINAALNLIGAKFRIIRTPASTGAFTLDVGTGPLKSLATGQWCDIEYSTVAAAWVLTAFGSL